MTVPISPRQAEVLTAVVAHFERHGRAPTMVELGDIIGCSRQFADEMVDKLAAKGFLAKEPGTWRGVRVVRLADGTRVRPALVPVEMV